MRSWPRPKWDLSFWSIGVYSEKGKQPKKNMNFVYSKRQRQQNYCEMVQGGRGGESKCLTLKIMKRKRCQRKDILSKVLSAAFKSFLFVLGHCRWREILRPFLILLSGRFSSYSGLWHLPRQISSRAKRALYTIAWRIRTKLSCGGSRHQKRSCNGQFSGNCILCWRVISLGTKWKERKGQRQLQRETILWNECKIWRKRSESFWFYIEHVLTFGQWRHCKEVIATNDRHWSWKWITDAKRKRKKMLLRISAAKIPSMVSNDMEILFRGV